MSCAPHCHNNNTMSESDSEPEPDSTSEQESKTSKTSKTKALQFVPEDIIEHFTMMIYGARRVGKTHIATHILSKIHKRFKEVHLFSETIQDQPDAWDFIPEMHKHHGFVAEDVEAIMDGQEKETLKATKMLKKQNPKLKGDKLRDAVSKLVPSIAIVMDDVINDPRIRGHPVLRKVFISGRHKRLSLIFLSQSPAKSAAIGRMMRCNVDYCIASEFDTYDDVESVASMFFCKEGKREGIQRINELTDEPHKFAISFLHQRGKKKLVDHTMSFKAPKKLAPIVLNSTQELKGALHSTKTATLKRKLVGYRKRESVSGVDFGDSGRPHIRTRFK